MSGRPGSAIPCGAEAKFPQVHLELPSAEADGIASLLFELGATGVEERDEGTLSKGPGQGRVLLVASFDEEPDAHAAIEALREHDAGLSPRFEELVGDAWRDEWKRFYEPFALTRSVTVRPPWQEAPASAGAVMILEPGRAFGTGLHSTTSLVAEMLEDAAPDLSGQVVLDAGCGSGILALLALMLGASRASLFDIDPDVVGVVLENAERNGLAERIQVSAGTIEQERGVYPWVLANIESRILGPIAEPLAARVSVGGHLLLSGILTNEEDAMRARFTSLSVPLELVDVRRRTTGGERASDIDGWVALHLRRTG